MNKSQDIRWKQRFGNFKNAFILLREALDEGSKNLNQLEKEGVIQRFEYTFELAWKVLKDKIENDGISLDLISPKSVIRQAFESKYIQDIEIWLKMIGDRNLLSHTYDFKKFEIVINSIEKEYLNLLNDFYLKILQEVNET